MRVHIHNTKQIWTDARSLFILDLKFDWFNLTSLDMRTFRGSPYLLSQYAQIYLVLNISIFLFIDNKRKQFSHNRQCASAQVASFLPGDYIEPRKAVRGKSHGF